MRAFYVKMSIWVHYEPSNFNGKRVLEMESDVFELAFGNFLESEAYDRAESELFLLVRAAFLAGWRAAGGKISGAQNAPCRIDRLPRSSHSGGV